MAACKLIIFSGDHCYNIKQHGCTRSPLCAFVLLFIALPDLPSPSTFPPPQLVQNTPQFRAAEGETPLVLLPGRPPARLSLDAPLSATGAVKDGQKQVRFTAAYCVFFCLFVQPVAGCPAKGATGRSKTDRSR